MSMRLLFAYFPSYSIGLFPLQQVFRPNNTFESAPGFISPGLFIPPEYGRN